MKRKSHTSSTILIRKRKASLKKLAGIGPIVRGSLVTVQRGNHLGYQLTVSVDGKTHTVYVPLDMVEEVRGWIENYEQMQRLVEEVSEQSMALIRCYVPESRARERKSGKRRPK